MFGLLFIALLTPPSVLYPAVSSRSDYNHLHPAHLELNCDRCHPKAPSSIRASDNLYPDEQVCTGCHTIKSSSTSPLGHTPSGRIVGRQVSQVITSIGLKFSHQLHTARQIDCRTCHVFKSASQRQSALPSMDLSRIVTNMRAFSAVIAATSLARMAHCKRSLASKSSNRMNVVLCSSRSWIQINHAQLRAYLLIHAHPAIVTMSVLNVTWVRSVIRAICNYIHQHGIDAKVKGDTCSCHQPRGFAQCCARSGVQMRSGWTSVAPHSARKLPSTGFRAAASGRVSPNHHKHDARRNLRSCVSCHQENDCVRCHGTTTPIGLRASLHRCVRL